MAVSRSDYAAALNEMGYGPAQVSVILAEIESQQRSGTYPGFRSALRAANDRRGLRGQFRFQELAHEPAIRLMEVSEAADAGDRRPLQELMEARAPESAVRELRDRRTAVLLDMTDAEMEGRVDLRPEIAKRYQEAWPGRQLIEGARLPTGRERVKMQRLEEQGRGEPMSQAEWNEFLGLGLQGDDLRRQQTLDQMRAEGWTLGAREWATPRRADHADDPDDADDAPTRRDAGRGLQEHERPTRRSINGL